MSFEFRSLTLNNWLVYGGDIKITFEKPNNERNLIIFYGYNGFGKTSLLKALQFVFHGRFDKDELFNSLHDGYKDNDGKLIAGLVELAVIIEFVHNDSNYQLTRKVDFSPYGSTYSLATSVELIIDGRQKKDQVDDIIELIIPKQTQQFVFFDGAEITRYSKRQHEDGVKDAIEQVLGIPAIRNLRYDLETLISKLENEQAEILEKQSSHTGLIQEKETIEDLIETLESNRKDTTERVSALKDALEKLQGEQIQVRLLEQDIRSLEDKEKRKADNESALREKEQQIDEQIKQAPLRLLVKPIQSILHQSEARQNVMKKRTLSIERKRIIEEILNDGNCICGRDIDETASQVLENMLQRIDVIVGQTNEKGELSSAELNQLSRILSEQNSKSASVTELIKRKSEIIDTLSEIDSEIRKLREKLQGHENTTISDLYQRQEDYDNRLSVEMREQIRIDMDLEKAKNNLNDTKRKLDQFMAQTSQGEALQRTLSQTRNLYDAVSEYVDKLVAFKREQIEGITTQIFLTITNKPDEYAGVYVKDDYTLQVYRLDGSVVENDKLSAGEKEVLAYSFITALNLSTETPAPFVMDTPFGHLDITHRNRLLESLPKLGVQVFLLATDRDLPRNERDRVEKFILQEFKIDRDQQQARSLIEAI